jgi:dCMP deaminase
MKRLDWDEYFSRIAIDVSKRSTCLRHQFGAVIVNSKNGIVSTGYNGVVKNAPHCTEKGCTKNFLKIKSGTGHEICPAVHAEQNALLQSGRLSEGGTLYINAFPCKICAILIVNSGINRVVVSGKYSDKEGLDILRAAKIRIKKIKL